MMTEKLNKARLTIEHHPKRENDNFCYYNRMNYDDQRVLKTAQFIWLPLATGPAPVVH